MENNLAPSRRHDPVPLALYGDNSAERYPVEAMLRSRSASNTTTTAQQQQQQSPSLPLPSPSNDLPRQSPVPSSPESGDEGLFQVPINRARTSIPEAEPQEPANNNKTPQRSIPGPSAYPADEYNPYRTPQERQAPATVHNFSHRDRNIAPSTPPAQSAQSSFAHESESQRHDDDFMDWNTEGADLQAFKDAKMLSSSPEPTSSPPPASSSSNLSREPTGNRPFTTVFPDLIDDEEMRRHALTARTEAYRSPPAEKRFVAAGGTTPLHMRQPIEAPPALDPQGASAQGFSMTKDELFRRLEKERRLEQAAAAERQAVTGDGQTPLGDRLRRGSGAKIGQAVKRVFSRKNSKAE